MGGGEAHRDQAIRHFNETFYRSDPADYLLTRLQLLILVGARSRELGALLADGVSYAGVTLGSGEPSDRAETEGEDDDLAAFLTIESQQLLHHACETALRLFLVHASRTSVPWIALSSERSFSKFKQTVRAEFVDTSPAPELIAYVCLGNRERPTEVEATQWDGAIEGIAAFLQAYAECFLDDALIYNAIKHGLGVSAGEAQAIVNSHHLGHGPSIQFAESTNWDSGDVRDWSLTTRWIDVGQSLSLVASATELIGSIWRIGRFRKLGGTSAGDLFFPVGLRPSDLTGSERAPMRRMSWRLLSERRT